MNFLFRVLLIHVACLFAHSVTGQTFNILDYGAILNSGTLSTKAINNAVNACHDGGGGRVLIPSGRFTSGTIVLKSNVELYLDRGAILYSSTDTNELVQQPQPAYRSQKDQGGWFALIYAEGASNIGISGKGTIDGNGAKQLSRPQFPGGDLDGRPRNILFISCKNVSVDGVTMLNAGIWNQHYLNCEDVIINNIRVDNHSNKNNDGIDIDGCRRVILSNSIIDSDDDGIVLKSTGEASCEDIVITNCIVSSNTNAIKCGTESTGGFKNITISNCVVQRSKSKVRPFFKRTDIGISGISLEVVDGGVMDGIRISNIVIEETECPLFIRLGNRARVHTRNAPHPPIGIIRNISVSDVTAYNTGNYSSSITGIPDAKIENVYLSNLRFVNRGGVEPYDYVSATEKVSENENGYPEPTVWGMLPSSGFFLRHIKNISLFNISLGSLQHDSRPPLIGIDIENLRLQHFSVDNTVKSEILLKDVKKIDRERNLKIVVMK